MWGSAEANKIATHYINKTQQRATSEAKERIIKSAENMLTEGYTPDEIIDVIDYVIDVKKVDMYSFGYVAIVINDVLRQIEQEKQKELNKEIHKQLVEIDLSPKEVAKYDASSAERNRNKFRKSNAQSRFGKKSDFHMP